MELDFTYDVYAGLLEAATANGYEVLSVREYLELDEPPERYLVLRHDVDRKPENALDVARIEADAGVQSTFYFRVIEKTFRPTLITEIADMGHEVGYHYEDLDVADGDVDRARESFRENLERFRELARIDTVSMHGNPLTPHDNRDLWENASFADHDLLGEVYLSVDFSEVVYFSDTNRTWYDERTIVNDWPVGPSRKPVQIDSTGDLMNLLDDRTFSQLYVLTHPNRWADSPREWLREYTKDAVINAGKFGLWAVRSARGRGQANPQNV